MNHIIAAKCFFCRTDARLLTLSHSEQLRQARSESHTGKWRLQRECLSEQWKKEETPAQKNRKLFFLSSVKISRKLSTSISSSFSQPWLFTTSLYTHSNYPFAFSRFPHSLSLLLDYFTKLQSTTELHPNISSEFIGNVG